MFNEIQVGTQNVKDGVITRARGTKDGAQAIQAMHGPYYEAALRGNTFHASTVIAGKVVVVAAATLGGVFTIHNPAGSNKNIELISFAFGLDSATIVVNTVGLLIQRNLTGTSGVPTSLTTGSVHRLGLAGNTPAGIFYSVATLTNVAIPGAVGSAVPIPFYPMITFPATADTNVGDYRHEFKGKIILEPDSLVSVCTSQASMTISPMAMDWAEWDV